MKRSCLIFIAIGATLLAACSLAGDVTPPPGSRSSTVSTPPATLPTAAPPIPAGLAYPGFKPSSAEGAALFAQHCAACHGLTGKGDGTKSAELLAQRSGEPLPDFSTPDLARAATPAMWFQIITEGRLDKFMPPWSEKLSEAQRWNLVAFVYTLSTPQEKTDSGKAVYAASCAECHGEGGQGDGPKAEAGKPMPDFTDQKSMAAASQSDFFNVVTNGLGDGTHAFQSALTDDERWAALDYVRAFAYEYTAPGAAPIATEVRVTGAVTNGTGGAAIPEGLTVNLHGFDDFTEAATLSTTVGVAGTFQFENVPYVPGRQFIVAASYQGVIYGSDLLAFDGGQTPAAAVTIFESTSDPAALRVERMHVFFDFAGGQATVGELFLLSNEGDKTIAQQDAPTVEFPLPSGATDVTMQGGQEGVDFVRTAEGIALTAPIRPGPNAAQVLLSFHLPYDRELNFEQKILHPVNALNVLLPEVGVKLRGGELQDGGSQDIQGTTYHTFDASGLAAGDTVTFQLSGEPGGAASGAGAGALTASNSPGIGIGLGAVALVLVGAGLWWLRRARAAEAEPESREDLLQAVAELDDDFEAGDIGEGEYRRERTGLKAKLIKLMEE
jgi:mono/diheme cytochrome c family protein